MSDSAHANLVRITERISENQVDIRVVSAKVGSTKFYCATKVGANIAFVRNLPTTEKEVRGLATHAADECFLGHPSAQFLSWIMFLFTHYNWTSDTMISSINDILFALNLLILIFLEHFNHLVVSQDQGTQFVTIGITVKASLFFILMNGCALFSKVFNILCCGIGIEFTTSYTSISRKLGGKPCVGLSWHSLGGIAWLVTSLSLLEMWLRRGLPLNEFPVFQKLLGDGNINKFKADIATHVQNPNDLHLQHLYCEHMNTQKALLQGKTERAQMVQMLGDLIALQEKKEPTGSSGDMTD